MPKGTMVDTHSTFMGYLLWIFGFTGSHRFYYGKPIPGPSTFSPWVYSSSAGSWTSSSSRPWSETPACVSAGRIDYSLAWILLTFLGLFGVHRMYMGKWITGILYMLTAGSF